MCDEIGVALRFFMQCLQPIEIRHLGFRIDNVFFPSKRRIPHDRIKATDGSPRSNVKLPETRSASGTAGSGGRPVQRSRHRRQRLDDRSDFTLRAEVEVTSCFGQRIQLRGSRTLSLSAEKKAAITRSPVSRARFPTPRRPRRVPWRRLLVRLVVPCGQNLLPNVLGDGLHRIGDRVAANHTASFARLAGGSPPHGTRQSARRSARPANRPTQRVIQERERMVLGQRRQPQRQLREVHRHRVLVDAVQATLGDQPPGMQDLVFIRRRMRAHCLCRCQALTSCRPVAGRLPPRTRPSPWPGRRPSGRESARAWVAIRASLQDGLGAWCGRSVPSANGACSANRCGGAHRWLQDHRALWDRCSRRVRGDLLIQGRQQVLDRLAAFFERFGRLAGDFWSVCSLSHFARSPAFCVSSSSRLIVAGAPVRLGRLDGDARPWRLPDLKPIIVSYTLPICSTSSDR